MVIIPDPRWVDGGGPDSPRLIRDAVHCESCGYLLKMLPRIGRCPECGSNYDVTAAHREGVFSPQDVEFPYLDVTWSIIGCLMLVWQVIGLATQPEVWVGLFTLVFAVITPLFVKQTWRRVRQYLDAIRQESSAD